MNIVNKSTHQEGQVQAEPGSRPRERQFDTTGLSYECEKPTWPRRPYQSIRRGHGVDEKSMWLTDHHQEHAPPPV